MKCIGWQLLTDYKIELLRVIYYDFPYCLCRRTGGGTETDMEQKLMIIEDEPLIRNELRTLLVSNGYEVSAPEDLTGIVNR